MEAAPSGASDATNSMETESGETSDTKRTRSEGQTGMQFAGITGTPY